MGKRQRRYERLLKKYYGYENLKEQQFKIIDRIVYAQRDVLAILATGFGKSMCYQLPHLITQKCVFVISPLLALMQDQHNELQEKGIPSCCLNSHNTNKSADRKRLLDGEPMIVYLAPEYFVKCEKLITKLYQDNRICCFAIDESHCVSSWSDSSFRPEYKELNKIREWAPQVPILALTATASEKVRDDIVKYLQMDKFRTVKSSFDRPNLLLSIHSKSPPKKRKYDLMPLMKRFKEESMIIYARTRKQTERISSELNTLGYECLAYHAGMDKTTRNRIQDRFMSGEVNCIVATVAFGMGINNPKIRLVVHYGCPSELESYYQEIGRAGRDGGRSECHLFYDSKDFRLSRTFLEDIEDPKFRSYKEKQIEKMEQYVHSRICRRKVILKHFGEDYDLENCKMCDICLSTRPKEIEVTQEAVNLFKLIDNLQVNFGTNMLINILRGSNNKKIIPAMKKLPQYGAGRHKTAKWWQSTIRSLIVQSYLAEEVLPGRFGGSVLSNGYKAKDIQGLIMRNKQIPTIHVSAK